MARSKAIIVDLDGSAALRGDRGPYEFEKCDEDHPNPPVVECVRLFAEDGYEIIFCTGREEKYRPQTERFIHRHFPWLTYDLFMRKSGDTKRRDAVIKREIYEGKIVDYYDVLIVLDDRQQVVDMWREIGLACFQVAPSFD